MLEVSVKDGLSIVIPAYNEAESIGSLLECLYAVMCESGWLFEVIVVDDGSTDATARIVSGYPARLISHGVNKGYGASLKSGIRAANFDLVVMMDSDGQHDPRDIVPMAELARANDLVVGARSKQSHTPPLRRPGKWLLQAVANYLAGMRIPDLNSGFRAFKRDFVLEYTHILPSGFSFSTTLTLAALKQNYKVAWMPITTAKRAGKSTVNPIADGYNTFILILRTIVLFDPLKVFLPPSIFLGLFGVLFSCYGILRFRSVPESGVIVIVSAILLFFLGILADSISALRLGMKS